MRHFPHFVSIPAAIVVVLGACGDDNSGTAVDGGSGIATDGGGTGGGDSGTVVVPASCNGSVASVSTPVTSLTSLPSGLSVVSGFAMEVVAEVSAPRELAALPNGDLLVGTNGDGMYIVPNAEADALPGKAVKFAPAPDANPAGVTFVPTTCTIYWGTNQGIYKATYKDGDLTGNFGSGPIAKVRQTSGGGHATTSVAFANGMLYASVGSSCNACTEIDPTRASIQQMNADGTSMTTKAAHIRNAIAITTNPDTGTLWAGGAGQDSLPEGHPYEFFDAVGTHAGMSDYGWPSCEENHQNYGSGADCSQIVEPLIELTAYSTIIGASFYSKNQNGKFAFPASYKGGLFLTNHGSWHTRSSDGSYFSPPRLAFVAMNGDTPATPVDWTDPTKQWTPFVSGWSQSTARATGVAVGAKGSLFVADDATGLVYRIRPN